MDESQYMKKSTSPLLYILFVVALALAGFGLYTIINKDKAQDNQDNKETVVEDENTNNNEQESNESPQVNEDENAIAPAEEETSITTDFSKFSVAQKSVGSETNEAEYTLASVTNSDESGYHKFVFSFTPKGDAGEAPYIVAKYIPSQGVIRMDLNGTTTDNSGIGYQKSVDIKKDGVVRIYHNVSSDQTEELYDIGVAAETPFNLEVQETAASSAWDVILSVKYPGSTLAPTDLDLGSEEFSKDSQTITGAIRSDGAKVTAYSYSASGGVLRVAYTVAGNSAKPIPSATAGYDGDGKLVLRFTDVASDTIAKMPAALTMSGGITMTWEMDGSNSSVYTFDGASKEFKLSATQSPNQVIIEIKL